MGRAASGPGSAGRSAGYDVVIPATIEEIARALGAPLLGPGDEAAVVTALTADSRTVIPGALFVALPGERVDGHNYVAAAAAAGAAASLTRHPVDGALCVVVADPLVAVGRLLRYPLDQPNAAGLQGVGTHRLVSPGTCMMFL